jgi:hypothetical protein
MAIVLNPKSNDRLGSDLKEYANLYLKYGDLMLLNISKSEVLVQNKSKPIGCIMKICN